jgi:hypothetical protein
MEPDSSGGGWSDLSALPEADRDAARVGNLVHTLEVDGETFAVHAAPLGGTHYKWLSGPNDGYGFSSSADPGASVEEHLVSIRSFLAMVDPITGYIEAD